MKRTKQEIRREHDARKHREAFATLLMARRDGGPELVAATIALGNRYVKNVSIPHRQHRATDSLRYTMDDQEKQFLGWFVSTLADMRDEVDRGDRNEIPCDPGQFILEWARRNESG